jgi:hypothetical protein
MADGLGWEQFLVKDYGKTRFVVVEMIDKPAL